DLAIHHFDQRCGNCQAETSASEFSVGGAIRLGEGLKNNLLLVWRNANAGISNTKMKVNFVHVGEPGIYGNEYFTLIRKLNGTAHQINQHLAEAARITGGNFWNAAAHLRDQLQAFLASPESQGRHSLRQHLAQA